MRIPATDVHAAIDAASLAELAWVTPAGTPAAVALVPLRMDNRPAVALPYAFADRLRALAWLPAVTLSLTDPRMTGRAWRALAVSGRPTVIEDTDASVFGDLLLSQELRKHPPSRAYVDSPMLRRENWWFLPRVVLSIEVTDVHDLDARTTPGEDGLLVTVGAGAVPVVDAVRVTDWGARPLELSYADRRPVTRSGPAALLGHDVSVPDLERWVQRLTVGRLTEGALVVDREPDGPLVLPPPLRLRERLRRHRALEKGCRDGIAAAERATHRSPRGGAPASGTAP